MTRSQRHLVARQGYASNGESQSEGESGSGGVIIPFAFQTETNTFTAALTNAPTTNRKRWADRTFRRLKANGSVFSKLRWISLIGADEDFWQTNWKNPAEKLIKVGTPTFVADSSVAGAAGQNFYSTPFNANTLPQNDCGVYGWFQTINMNGTALLTAACIGVIDGSSNGFSITPNNTSNVISARCAGPVGSSNSGSTDGFGLIGAKRSGAANIDVGYNGINKSTLANASAALPALPFCIGGLNNNGVVSNGVVTQIQAFVVFSSAPTAAELSELTATIGEWIETVKYGDYYCEERGVGSALINVQHVIDGLTIDAVFAACSIRRAGETVAIMSGKMDAFTYGMTGGGLGYTDADSPTGFGGLWRYMITRCNTMEGKSDVASGKNPTAFKINPKRASRVIRELLKFYNIPVYLTSDTKSIIKTGAAITTVTTNDGRTFNASQFMDATDDLDLTRKAGVGVTRGREAAGSGQEAANGFESLANMADALNGAAAVIRVDPWVIPGDTNSGLLPGISYIYSTFTPALHNYPAPGSADPNGCTAFNFRLTLTNTLRRIPMDSTPPPGFVAANFEAFIRMIDAAVVSGSPLLITDIFKMDEIQTTGTFDVNTSGLLSSDAVGMTSSYPTATPTERRVIRKNIWNRILGLWYVLQYHADARIPGALRTAALTWGWASDHYYSPHEDDKPFQSPGLYARETWRMIGSVIFNANHACQPDGQVPTLGNKTVTHASYGLDSHGFNLVAVETSAGVWTIKGDGGLLIASGVGGSCGADWIGPLPFDIFVPKVAECSNLYVTRGGSMTHVAYGCSRMEPTAGVNGQTGGAAMVLARQGDGIIQNVSYPALRTAVLVNPLAGEVVPVLQQLT